MIDKTIAISAVLVLLVAGCTSPAPSTGGGRAPAAQGTGGQKTIVVGITDTVTALGTMGSSTTSGGWQSLNELHSQGLVTADREIARPTPRLARELPSVEQGTIAMLPDGRMRSVYNLRSGVTWQDGTPFTAHDMVFAYQINSDPNLPFLNRDAIQEMDSVEAVDDHTFVIYWRGPYYQADSIGLRALWPQPRHILESSYQTLDRPAFVNLPYWTSEYVHLGPFRMADFRPGELLTFAAYEGYFLGKPKADRVIIRMYNDEAVLYSAVLAGAIDVLMDNSLSGDLGLELKETWDSSGGGTVHVGMSTTRFVSPQFDPELQHFPPVLDARVRQALLFGLDRAMISSVVQRGHGELIANALLPPGDRLYEAVKDGFAQYVFDQARARSMLGELGWSPGADGVLVGPEGRRFNVGLWTTEGGEKEIAVIADYWKQIGVSAEQYVFAGAVVRDREARSKFPGFETSARGSGDSLLSRVDSRTSAVPRNNYSGANRGHYVNPRIDELIDRYRQSADPRQQAPAIKALSDALAADLPLMLLYYNPTTPAVRKGVKALDDFRGGSEASRLFGTFSRNAHEWDLAAS
jgi:peptide/nickel transport system substrate-binding protein